MSDNFVDDDVYVIDSNEKIRIRLEKYQEEQIQKVLIRNQRKVEEFLNGLEYDEEGKPVIPVDEEGLFIIPVDDDGNPLVNIDEEGNIVLEPDVSEESEGSYEEGYEDEEGESLSPEEILEQANAQAEAILEDARSQGEALKNHMAEEGREEGYTEGVARGMDEYHAKAAEFEAEKQRLADEYRALQENLEGEMVDMVCDIVEQAFKVQFGASKEIILHLVDNTIANIGSSKVFIIRVNEANKEIIDQNKDMLIARVGTDATLDIIADPLMGEGDCLIETDGGVFNCGMDVELSGLLRDLRLLSIGHD